MDVEMEDYRRLNSIVSKFYLQFKFAIDQS